MATEGVAGVRRGHGALAALNEMRARHGLPGLTFDKMRGLAGHSRDIFVLAGTYLHSKAPTLVEVQEFTAAAARAAAKMGITTLGATRAVATDCYRGGRRWYREYQRLERKRARKRVRRGIQTSAYADAPPARDDFTDIIAYIALQARDGSRDGIDAGVARLAQLVTLICPRGE